MRLSRFVFALALASAFAFGGPNLALATMEGHEASVVDPFLACPLTPDVFGGVNYPNTEPEVWLAHNPANVDNYIGTFQQDRWSDGGARGLVAGYSFNDGHLWNDVALPFSKCAIPYYSAAPCPISVGSPVPCTLPYDRASDPWHDIGPDGTAYTVSISFNANDNNNAVGGSVSLDGGATWTRTTEIIHDIDADPTFPFNDKESVTADPVVAGSAYAVWDRLVLVSCGPAGRSQNEPKADDRKWRGASHLAAPGTTRATNLAPVCFEGPTFFSKTVDGGQTWSTPMPIVSNSPDEQTIANQIVVDPKTGTLYDFYVYFPNVPPFTPELRMVFSHDKGATWSTQQFINTEQTVEVHDPQVPDNVARTGDIIPEPAIDPNTGQLYLVWQDGRMNDFGEDDVLLSTSVGGGLTGTWTAPQKVDLPEDRSGFTPGIKVNSMSQLGVDYYSLRHPDLGPDVWPVERYLRISSGPAVVSTPSAGQAPVASIDFNTPTRDAGPFNMLMAPNAGGFFTGDYEGMAIDRDGKSFHSFFATMNCDTTNCPAVGYPAPATGTVQATGAGTSSPPDPMDVYSNQYYKQGS
jgi:hypothetical protein